MGGGILTVTLDDISVAAYKGEQPDIYDLTVPEWLLWYRLRDVYREHAADPTAGAAAKQKALAQFETDRNDWVKTKEVYQVMSAMWKDIEEPARTFVKDRTVPNAERFFEAVYRVPLKKQSDIWEKEDTNT